MAKITNNFRVQEFDSKDGKSMPAKVMINIIELAKNLQVLRDYLQTSININSGYRSPDHNKKINGAKNSFHVKGMAADISVKGIPPKEVERAIRFLMAENKIKKGGLKAYRTFVHYDTRGHYATW